ncbi:MAG: IS66 family transposase [Elusimicrobia bacterium]|nr:IS66 family transposase [Elusimicrobiota bacterium]
MIVPPVEVKSSDTLGELRWRVGHYQALHARAVERESVLKERVDELEKTVRQQEIRIAEQAEEIENLKAQRAWLKQQLFGQKSEQTKTANDKGCLDDSTDVDLLMVQPPDRQKRGQQPGSQGHGRRNRNHPKFTTEVIEHELPPDQQVCPRCRLPFAPIADTEDSEEIDWVVRIVRRVHKRKRYKPTCACGAVPCLITAPPPAKLIPKGMFAIDFWVRFLIAKFLIQLPVHRVLIMLAMEGLEISPGTIAGGFRFLAPLLEPVYNGIVAHSHQARLRKMDETRWFVFILKEGKEGYLWWMWIDVTEETVVYILDPSRSAEVVRKHLGPWDGFLLVDCYSAYKAHQVRAARLGIKILIAFCWAHRRRDFVEISDGHPRLRAWAEGWVARINAAFHINGQRVEAPAHSPAFEAHDQNLRQAMADMADIRDRELADAQLHPIQKQVLECLSRHWEGLTLFVEHPEIPMDNNESERLQRILAVGRKNYYGSGSLWSGHFSAHAFTIIQTLRQNGVDPQQWFSAYFKACAENGGRVPQSIEPWLPWNLSQEQKTNWLLPCRPP